MIVASPMRRPWMLLKLTGIHGGGEGALLTHSLSIEEAEINAGDAIAKDITGFGDLFFGPAGAATEDAIFKKLPQMPTDKTSMHDQLPGKENAYTIVVGHPGSPIDVDPIDEPADTSKKLFSGSYMLYVVVRVNYRDTSGRPHTTEQCLVGTNLEDNMGYCIGHNGMN